MLIAPGDHAVLVFLVQVTLLVVAAHLCGAAARRVGQPAVVGELVSGVLLGPSLLGRVLPDVASWVFPPDAVQGGMLFALGWLGVMLLLVGAGAETDIQLLRSLGRAAAVVALSSLLVPLAAGVGLGFVLPGSLLGDGAERWVFALFLGVALAISALPVIAKVLADLGMLRRNVGQLTLAAATVNDVVGWLLLGVISGLAGEGGADLGRLVIAVAGVAALGVVTLTAGQRVVDAAIRRARTSSDPSVTGAAMIVVLAVGLGIVTQWLHVEAVLGAFLAGIAIGRSRFRDETALRLIEVVTRAVLAPVFFATAGLRADLGALADPTVFGWALAVVVVATLGKLAGGWLGGRLSGLPNRENLALGAGLNARGALEIVIASVGLQLGVLNPASYTAVVLMAVVTSAMAPPMLRACLAGWAGTEAEQARLAAENLARTTVLVSSQPVVLPTRGGPSSILAAQLVDLVWSPDVPVTVLCPQRDASRTVRDVFGERPARILVRDEPCPLPSLLREAGSGHGAVVVGLPDRPDGDAPSTALRLAATSPVPVVLVRGERISGRRLPPAIASVLVPVSGGPSARAAQEIGFGLSARIGSAVNLAHVVTRPDLGAGPDVAERSAIVADRLLADARAFATTVGASTGTITRVGDPASELLALSVELGSDLVVVGVQRRHVDGEEIFLGHTVEHLLAHCPATVAVVVTPPGWAGH